MSRFLKLKCTDCGNEQVAFERAAQKIGCLVCGATLATPTGGRAVIKGELVSALE